MVENSYFDFAENDFLFFQQTYQAGIRGNALAALGQSICERYLKHIADRYANPEDEMESFKKQSVLRTHNLRQLLTTKVVSLPSGELMSLAVGSDLDEPEI